MGFLLYETMPPPYVGKMLNCISRLYASFFSLQVFSGSLRKLYKLM